MSSKLCLLLLILCISCDHVHPGGNTYYQTDPHQQSQSLNLFKKISDIPLEKMVKELIKQ